MGELAWRIFLEVIMDLKLSWRRRNIAGRLLVWSDSEVGVTFVKYTHVPHRPIVKMVNGMAIAARSQELVDSLMFPPSPDCTNCVEKKFYDD